MSKTSPKEFVENLLRDKGYYVRRVEDICIVPKGVLADVILEGTYTDDRDVMLVTWSSLEEFALNGSYRDISII